MMDIEEQTGDNEDQCVNQDEGQLNLDSQLRRKQQFQYEKKKNIDFEIWKKKKLEFDVPEIVRQTEDKLINHNKYNHNLAQNLVKNNINSQLIDPCEVAQEIGISSLQAKGHELAKPFFSGFIVRLVVWILFIRQFAEKQKKREEELKIKQLQYATQFIQNISNSNLISSPSPATDYKEQVSSPGILTYKELCPFCNKPVSFTDICTAQCSGGTLHTADNFGYTQPSSCHVINRCMHTLGLAGDSSCWSCPICNNKSVVRPVTIEIAEIFRSAGECYEEWKQEKDQQDPTNESHQLSAAGIRPRCIYCGVRMTWIW
ncbi:MAG: hypothetical protein EZS28_006096 [Streblomastix strix]|uniref:Uncharacterized protein n=1 Tax=Streblomastix strix TaxID=222440 RepID=A0A5J4WTJ6_9EUKA|nr:MAG: hypothetical protein EZS28_006096 [Streblomastix strix]